MIKASQTIDLDKRSRELRKTIIRTLAAGGRGHMGAAMSLVEIVRVLYDDVLRYDSNNARWEDRDRCVLSKGHGCLAHFAILADKGFFPEEELWTFCKDESMLGGHPEIKVPGVEASTGSLGHGLAFGIGMALAARFDKKDYRTFVILGDGECNEGSIWEGALSAGKHKLNNLTVLIDYNKNQSYGSTYEVQNLEPFGDKWRAFGFEVKEVNGHDVGMLKDTLQNVPLHTEKPAAIICHTVKGKGIKAAEGNLAWHHKNKFPTEEVDRLIAELEAANA